MTEERAFKYALLRIGFNTLIAEQIIINRFNKIEILGDIKELAWKFYNPYHNVDNLALLFYRKVEGNMLLGIEKDNVEA